MNVNQPRPGMSGIRFRTVPAALVDRAERTPDAAAYWHREMTGWTACTWREVFTRVRSISAWLDAQGLQRGDRVALMMPSSPEWEYCHLAALAAGGIVVGLDAHDSPDNLRHILALTTPTALLLHSAAEKALIEPLLQTPARCVLLVEAEDADVPTLARILAERSPPAGLWPIVRETDVATILFTSGSTGRSKGLGYTHGQLMMAAHGILDCFPRVGPQTRLACWLPLSNPFQRIIDICTMLPGAQTYFVESPALLMQRLPEIRPSLLVGVPRFFEKLSAGIEENVDKRKWPVRTAVRVARRLAARCGRHRRAGRRVPTLLRWAHHATDALILRRLRSVLGGEIEFMISGSAPIAPWLLEQFEGMGLLTLEAYGLSENILPIAINTPENFRFGSVGRVLPGNELRVSESGELLVRGEGVAHLRCDPAHAETAITDDGFLRTGDIGHIDDEGYVWLTGRTSDIFKTSTGRRIAPVTVEAALKRLGYVEHAIILGSGRPIPIAILAISSRSESTLVLEPGALERLAEDVRRTCRSLPAHQRPGAVLVTQRPFGIESGELTSNLKLKRAAIARAYASDIDRAYEEILSAPPRIDYPLVLEVR